MNKETQIIIGLKNGDERTIHSLYKAYKPEFLAFASKYNLTADDLLDVYQDAMVALCENAKKGNLENLNSTVKTYFFSIGKYMIFARLKKKKQLFAMEDLETFPFEWEDEYEEMDEEIVILKNLFKNLGEQCQQILRLFYYEEKNLDEITVLMNYENKNVAKTQKYRCIKYLKQLFKDRNNG
ncbi:sigma-70 family RNA polymerase sigma factor [Aequorivita sp. SDUM287046]|uniref:Sigma-70 family RNA polymerase sigma factor n=1 Tax=Aequorivita aurantiaca TaxID=3053356 RepID=A0ABT8DFB7_9FLAO|nr:sigma-70 family RNA polymerase sigma factor [Aequorivita aurantiaca]MDN3724036.1 sigma-70 family RNA polymerase sigma factor [Aequorivita aurantiaca]